MSPTDNIVSFRSPSQKVELPSSEEMTELEHSLVYIASFLLDNKDNIKNVVCGVMAKDGVDPKTDDFAFHLLTTPIDVADFALSLRFLEDGFRRHLPDPD